MLSPRTSNIDTGAKLAGYFRVRTVQHYLVVDALHRTVLHHRRGSSEAIETRIVREGALVLDPPGIGFDPRALLPLP